MSHFLEVGTWDAYCMGIMELLIQNKSPQGSELTLGMSTEILRSEASSRPTELFKNEPSTELQPAWMLAAVFFTIELP